MKNPFDNPVCRLDLRSRVRERRLWVLALFCLAVPLALALISLAVDDTGSSSQALPVGARVVSGFAIFGHGALRVLLSTLGAAQRISQERERRTIAALVNSPMSARGIAAGKLLAACTFAVWLGVLSLPFLAIASVWGGLSAAGLLACWVLNVAAACASASFALGLSGLFGRSLSAYLAVGASLFLWCAVCPVLLAVSGGLGGSGEPSELALSVFVYHLPLAPQVWIFSDFFEGEKRTIWPAVSALVVWSGIAFGGFRMAVRGLRREVF